MATTKKRLERLTPEQEALLPVVRDEWLAHGLSTERADRPAAEAAARLAYVKAGLPEPRFVVWLRSPMEGVIGTTMLPEVLRRLAKAHGDQVGGQVGDQVWDQVGGQVWGQVRDQVWDQVGGQVRDQVWDQVGGQVWDQVGGQVRDQVRDQVWDQVGGQVWGQVRYSLWGQHDAGWLSFMDAFGRLGIDTSLGDGLIGVGRSAGWWWTLRDAVVLTERPLVLHRGDRGRLHCETGPAIAYPDGWGVHAWHGVRVPADIVERPETVTIARIDAEANTEVRRVMLERYGYERFVTDSGATEVGRDDWGTLWRRDMPNDETLVVVEVVNSTPEPDGHSKRYYLRVPPAFGNRTKTVTVDLGDEDRARRRQSVARTPHAAIAWTFGLSPDEYRPAVMS